MFPFNLTQNCLMGGVCSRLWTKLKYCEKMKYCEILQHANVTYCRKPNMKKSTVLTVTIRYFCVEIQCILKKYMKFIQYVRKMQNAEKKVNCRLALSSTLISFYRAMHFSAYARSWDRMSSVRLSVCPSVTLVDCDHIDWKSWKLIARSTSPTPSLFVAKRRFT